jgi:hypothetical protein
VLTKRTLVQSSVIAAVFGAVLATSTAAMALDKITIMVGGFEKLIYLPFKLTESPGYYKEEGLEVELLNEPSGVDADAEDEMLAGAVQGVGGFYDHCVGLQSKGNSSNRSSSCCRRPARSRWCRRNTQRSSLRPILKARTLVLRVSWSQSDGCRRILGLHQGDQFDTSRCSGANFHPAL